MTRHATLTRETAETRVAVALTIEGRGEARLATGIPFFDHMLDQLARHGRFDLEVTAAGDLDVDFHHTVEDVGLALGAAFDEALGSRAGLARFGCWRAPLDEALAECVIDLSGRGGLYWDVAFSQAKIREFDAAVLREFWQGFARAARATVHLTRRAGVNAHHEAEALFKAAARALDQACTIDPRLGDRVPSTKESLAPRAANVPPHGPA